MKKRTALITVSVLFFIVSSAFAQNDHFESLAGKKVTTIIENISTPVAISEDAVSNPSPASGPAKTEKGIWETTFEKSTPLSASKKLKRIVFSVPGPQGIEKYDSDNSFESTEGAEDWVKKFVQVLGKPSQRKITSGEPSGNTSAMDNKTDNVWNSDLPPYDPSLYWNGLLVTIPSSLKIEKNAQWESNFSSKYGEIHNQFVILQAYNDSLKVSVKCQILFNEAGKGSLNADGAPAGVSLGLQKKQTTYNGVIAIDRKTMLLLKGTFKIEAISVLNINGSGTERKSYSITKVSNSIL